MDEELIAGSLFSDPIFWDEGHHTTESQRLASICRACGLCRGHCPAFDIFFDAFVPGAEKLRPFRLTCRPYWERLADMPEEDLQSEGGMCSTMTEFYDLIGKTADDVVAVIRFEKVREIKMQQDDWHRCYKEGWQGIIVPEAFTHPAKFARGLIRAIYEHAIEEGW